MAKRELLRRNPDLRALVASRAVSSAGTWLAYVALTVDVYTRTHSSVWVSAVLLADFLPTIAIASLAGPWLDRLPRRTLLVGSEILAGAVFAALPFAPSATAVVALALAAGVASAVFFPTVRATLPELVDESDLPQANSLSQTAGTSGLAAGPALAGLLVASAGVGLPYALNAASFAISAVLLARLPSLAGRAAAGREEGYWQSAAAGIRAFRDSAALRTIVQASMLSYVAAAVINVGEIFLAQRVFHAGTVGFGVLASASGIGVVAGSALAGRVAPDTAMRAARLALVAVVIGFGAAALAPNVWIAAACVVAGGVGDAVFLAAGTLLVQQSTDETIRGHAFAIFDAAGSAALGGGMAAGGLIVAALGARGAWLAAAGLVALAAASMLAPRTAAQPLRAEPELS
jgi:MFS family permease